MNAHPVLMGIVTDCKLSTFGLNNEPTQLLILSIFVWSLSYFWYPLNTINVVCDLPFRSLHKQHNVFAVSYKNGFISLWGL